MTLNLSLRPELVRCTDFCPNFVSFLLGRPAINFWFPRQKSLHRLAYSPQSPFAIHLVECRSVDEQVPPHDELARDQSLVFLLIVLWRLVPSPTSDLDRLCHLLASNNNILIGQWR